MSSCGPVKGRPGVVAAANVRALEHNLPVQRQSGHRESPEAFGACGCPPEGTRSIVTNITSDAVIASPLLSMLRGLSRSLSVAVRIKGRQAVLEAIAKRSSTE
jgi:hypothetical protein